MARYRRRRDQRVIIGGTGLSVPGPPRQSEASFMAQVIAYARLRGWHHWHDQATNAPRVCPVCLTPSKVKRNEAGLPDLILIRRPRLIFAELKRDGEYPTPAQQAWLNDLAACDQEAFCWHPADWRTLERILY